MTTTRGRPTENRTPLNRQRVLEAAVELADRDGLQALSMRKLGQSLDVEAMSLYNHVKNKDDLLDGIVDLVVGEFDSPLDREGLGWQATLRRCAIAAHAALLRHPWSAALAESRPSSGPARLRYYDDLMGMLRQAGFSVMGTYRANIILDSYIYGFALQEVSWPSEEAGESALAAAFMDRTVQAEYPHLYDTAELAARGEIWLSTDFEVGLDVILQSLERIREAD